MPRLIVEVVGDTRNLERAFVRANRATDRFGRQMSQTSRGAIAGSLAFKGLGRSVAFASLPFLSGAGLVAGLKAASSEASNLAEQTTKSAAVFGSSTRTIQNFAKNALGLANAEALQITGTFGALLRPMGFLEEAAADTSIELTKLGVDLASFSNTSVTDALDAIRSGLVGEVEPLRRFGVQLSEVRVAQEAMAATGKKSVKELTNQEKTAARLAIIYRDTALAQGDFAKTSGGLANQQRTLTANLKDLSAEIGTVLNPVILRITKRMNKWLEDPQNKKKVIDDFTAAIEGLGKAAEFTADAIGLLSAAWDKLPDFGKDGGIVGHIQSGSGLEEELQEKLLGMAGGGGKAWGVGIVKKFKAEWKAVVKNARKTIATNPLIGGGVAAADPVKTRPGISQAQRNQWFDTLIGRAIDRVQDVATLQGQVSALRKIAGLIRERLAHTKDITRQQKLEDDLLDISRQQRSLNLQIAANIGEAKAAALAKKQLQLARAREAAIAERARVSARIAARAAATKAGQFKALGLTGSGDEIVAGQRLLRQQLGRVSDAVSGTFLDTGKTRSILANVRKVLAGGLGEVGRDVRSKVKEILDGINDQLKNQEATQTKFRKTNVRGILRAAGLDPDEVKRVSSALSRVSAGGMSPGRGTGAFGMAVGGGATVIHNNLYVDGKKMATTTTKHQQKTRRRNPEQKRGPFAGGRIQ